MSKLTKEMQAAFDHVKKFHPTLTIVVINREGLWCYMDEHFNAFEFVAEVDTNILSAGVNSLINLPFIYQSY